VAKMGWEKIILPGMLYGLEAIVLNKGQVERLERIQLRMVRWILGTSRGIAKEVLWGELKWLTVQDYIDMRRLNFDVHLRELKEEWWHRMVWEEGRRSGEKGGNWERETEKVALRIGWNRREEGSREMCTKKIKGLTEKRRIDIWKEGMEGKSTLKWYKYKEWGDDGFLKIARGKGWFVKARGGDLGTRARTVKWSGKGDRCVACGMESETLEHILFECRSYMKQRELISNLFLDERNGQEHGNDREKNMLSVLGLEDTYVLRNDGYWERRMDIMGAFWKQKIYWEEREEEKKKKEEIKMERERNKRVNKRRKKKRNK
jgi:hypothetical protein